MDERSRMIRLQFVVRRSRTYAHCWKTAASNHQLYCEGGWSAGLRLASEERYCSGSFCRTLLAELGSFTSFVCNSEYNHKSRGQAR